MTINTSPASRDLTETGAIFNRAALRLEIARKTVAYQRAGGMIAKYAKGATWQTPYKVETRVGRKTVSGDVAAYVDGIKARLEAKAAAKRRLHDDRIKREAELNAVMQDRNALWP